MCPNRSGMVLVLFLASPSLPEETTPVHPPRLEAWFRELSTPGPGEPFGRYLARAGRIQHGVAYDTAASPPPGPERLRIELERFECVTFIESTLAVARCGYVGEPTAECFTREIVQSRYRGGVLSDYASRLHYFTEWIDDNESRGRLRNLTGQLGGIPVRKDFFRISTHELARASAEDELARKMRSVEARLSGIPHLVVPRESARSASTALEDGDIVAFVRERPGFLVHHAGFVLHVRGDPRLLHASSYHQKVVITAEDVADYLLRRPERKGVIVARPTEPKPGSKQKAP
ncbi:MAG TPA: N-acetylmuramoyl-L-alanine amidase-like domain-containing protein [Vicinamibacteria bacterium]|nr:N-acetylmuramoyl-L-alanine amidase-like domain-containing protein [Vicinamibacteria bacterium]